MRGREGEGRTEGRKEFREGKKNGWGRGEERIVGGRKGRMNVRRNSGWDRDGKVRMDAARKGGREPAI